MKHNKIAFYGGSISSRSAEEAKMMHSRFQLIQEIMLTKGYVCSGEVVSDVSISVGTLSLKTVLPKRFLEQGRDQSSSLTKRRVTTSDTMPLEQQVACHIWSVDELEKADICLWDLTRSSTGCGFEIALALAMKKPCFGFSENRNMSVMLNGCPSSLLMTVQYDKVNITQDLEQFLLSVANV